MKMWFSFLNNNLRRIRLWVSRCLWLCRNPFFCTSHVWKRDVCLKFIISRSRDDYYESRPTLASGNFQRELHFFWFNKELWLPIQEALTKQEQFPEDHFRTDRLRIISRMKGNNNKLLSLLREEDQKRRKFPGKYSRDFGCQTQIFDIWRGNHCFETYLWGHHWKHWWNQILFLWMWTLFSQETICLRHDSLRRTISRSHWKRR